MLRTLDMKVVREAAFCLFLNCISYLKCTCQYDIIYITYNTATEKTSINLPFKLVLDLNHMFQVLSSKDLPKTTYGNY